MQRPPSVPTLPPPDQLQQLLQLAHRVAQLNPHCAVIGAGMLASLVDEARRALGQVEEAAR